MSSLFSKFGIFAKMQYEMQLRGIFWTWYRNKNCTLWILDSIYMVWSMIAITNILYKFSNLKLKIILKFNYEQDIDDLQMIFVLKG